MKLFNIFKNINQSHSQKTQQSFSGPSIFYHEDDFLQVEILPSENHTRLKSESEKVTAFAKEHFDGNGFNDIYISEMMKTRLI